MRKIKNLTIKILVFLSAILLTSCNNNNIHREIIKSDFESFIIDSKEQNIITTKKGNTFIIPANSFERIDDTLKCDFDIIEVKLKEFTTISDILMARLFTISDDNLLETEGMFYIEALDGKNELKLKKSTSISLIVPNIKERDGILLFNGRNLNNGINWKLVGKTIPAEDKGELNSLGITSSIDTFRTYELGWINLDKYSILGITNITIKSKISIDDFDFCVILQNSKSIIPGFIIKNEIKFERLILGEKVLLIGIKKKIRNYELIKKEIVINGDDEFIISESKTLSKKQIITELNKLNGIWK